MNIKNSYKASLPVFFILALAGIILCPANAYAQSPPGQALNPTPMDMATDVPLFQQLSWDLVSDATTYEVYLDTMSPPTTWVGTRSQGSEMYDPGGLEPGTTYYWQIDTVNGNGTTTGFVWSFTTVGPPPQASYLTPVDMATDIPIEQDISWDSVPEAESYEIYFGTSYPPGWVGSQSMGMEIYDPGTLESNTQYYWRIDTDNVNGTTEGEVWSFTTGSAPMQATTPNPADMAMDVPIGQDLSWMPEPGADSYDVYFGDFYPPPFQYNQTGEIFDPGTLTPDTEYYWRIDTVSNDFGCTTGLEWSFTTIRPPNAPTEFMGGAISSTQIDWIWSHISPPFEDGFEVHNETDTMVASAPADTFSATEYDLLENEEYTRHVHAYTGTPTPVLYSDASDTYTVYTLCDPPEDGEVSVASITTSSAQLRVAMCPNYGMGSTAAYFYDTLWTWDSGLVTLTFGGSYYYYDRSGLSENTQYALQAKYQNQDANPTSNNSTPLYWYTLVGEPMDGDLTFGSVTPGSVEIIIEPPSNPDSGLTGCYIERSDNDGGSWIMVFDWSKTYTQTDSGCTPETDYLYRFKYRNGDGTETGYFTSMPIMTPENPPAAFSYFTPSPGATNVSRYPSFDWLASAGADTYDVYLDTTNPPTQIVSVNQSETYFDSGELGFFTTYYWKVVAWNTAGSYEGEVWSFKTRGLQITEEGFADTQGTSWFVYVSGDFAYVTDIDNGFWIFDVSNPSSPSFVGQLETPGAAYGVYVAGTKAYVADDSLGLQIIDLADKANPNIIGNYDTPDLSHDVHINGFFAFTAESAGSIKAIDISNPASPSFASSIGGFIATGLYVKGIYAFLADYDGNLSIADLSNPWFLSPVNVFGVSGVPNDVFLKDYTAYIASGSGGLQIVSVSPPETPSYIGSYNNGSGTCNNVFVHGDGAFLAYGNSGLHGVDIANPANPKFVGSYDFPGAEALGVFVNGQYIYVTDNNGRLHIMSIDGNLPPEEAYSPVPDFGEKNVPIVNASLNWGACDCATGYNVFLGQNNPPSQLATIAGTTFNPGLLNPNTTYYWYIVPSNNDGDARYTVWYFVTGPDPLPAEPTGLLANDRTNPGSLGDNALEFSAIYHDEGASNPATEAWVQVAIDPGFGEIQWSSGWVALTPSSCPNGARCPVINYGGPYLTPGTTYYWQIRFKNGSGEMSPFSTETAWFKVAQFTQSLPWIGNHMMEVPVFTGDLTVAEILGDDIGLIWIHRYDESIQDWIRLTASDTLENGVGYFIWCNEPGAIIGMSGGFVYNEGHKTIFLDDSDDGELANSGWNLIRNPFSDTISWSSCDLQNCEMTYYGPWNGTEYYMRHQIDGGCGSNTIQAGESFWVHANGSNSFVYIYDPGQAAPSSLPPPMLHWKVQITAKSGSLLDTQTFFGAREGALITYDQYDIMKIRPYSTDYMRTIFDHPEWGRCSGPYAMDVKPFPFAGGTVTWNMRVYATSANGLVSLSWNIPPELHSGWRFYIHDKTCGVIRDMTLFENYDYPASGEDTRDFTLTATMFEALLFGDSNLDGTVDESDAVLCSRAEHGLDTL